MYAKTFLVIGILADASTEYVTSGQLSSLLGISTRMVLRYMKEAQECGPQHGYEIRSFKGRGYQIEIKEPEVFKEFCLSNGRAQAALPDEEMIQAVIRRLLLEDGCKLDDLAEKFNYSRSSMSRITASAGAYLDSFGLQLVSKAYMGLYIKGNEISIRDCMYHLYQEEHEILSFWKQMDIEGICCSDILAWIGKCFEWEQITPSDKERDKFIIRLGITMKRISLNKEISFGYLADLDGLQQFKEQLKRTGELLGAYFPLRDLGGENIYLTLIWMQMFGKNSHVNQMNEHDMMFFHNLIMKAMKKIHDNYGVDLSGDEVLVNGLILHVASSYGKYLVHMESENPFYEELQKIYPTAYYYSIELAECIFEYTHINMSSSELGFLTIHFASSIERNMRTRTCRAVILDQGTPGTSLLLKSRIEKTYKSVEIIGTCIYDRKSEAPEDVDFYISVCPVREKNLNGREILTLTPFLNESDQSLIRQMLGRIRNRGSIASVCIEDGFFLWDRPVKKKVLLAELCGQLIGRGIMTQEDEAAVMSRENLVSTEIASSVAMPHCLVEGKSFMAFAITRTPVMWGRARVKLVILGGFQKGDKRIKEVLERLFQLVSDEEKVNRLVSCRNYEEFIACMKELDGGFLC